MTGRRTALCAVAGLAILLAASQLFSSDWPQWRGPNRDGKVGDFNAPETWPQELTQKWQIDAGEGDASPVLVGDKLYAFTRVGGDEVTLCLNAADGKEVWRDKNAVSKISGPAARQHAGPRATPAVADGKVVTLGVTGVLSCLDAAKGDVVWRKNDIQGAPRFFTSSSPIVADGLVVAQLGPEKGGAIVAYALADGAEKWKCENQGTAYASPVLTTAEGVKQIVTLTSDSVVGVALADGKLLWQIPFAVKGRAYNAATPIVDGATVIVTGQDRGTRAYKIEKKGDALAATEQWSSEVNAQFCTPVLNGGRLYGINERGILFCLDAKDGKTVWTEPAKLNGYGAMLDAGDAVLAMSTNSQLIVIKPGQDKYTELARWTVADSATYSYPVVDGKLIFVKGEQKLTCWSL